jgi:hypothetical protein
LAVISIVWLLFIPYSFYFPTRFQRVGTQSTLTLTGWHGVIQIHFDYGPGKAAILREGGFAPGWFDDVGPGSEYPSYHWRNLFRRHWRNSQGVAVRTPSMVPLGLDLTHLVEIPMPLLAILCLLPLAIRHFHRRWKSFAPGHCQTCGYDLRATPDQCPECGATLIK